MVLTEAAAKRAKAAGKDLWIWDDALPGFGIRVYRSGRKMFVFRYYRDKRRILTIGPVGALTVERARAAARELFLRYALPTRTTLSDRTFGELAADYLVRYAKVRKKSWKQDEQLLRRHILPMWERVETAELTRRDVELLFAGLSLRTPVVANRVLSLVKKMLTLAVEWGDIEANPAQRVTKNRETPRDVFLSREQLPKLMRALDPQPLWFRSVISLYLLTALRKTELLSLRWEDVNVTEKLVKVAHTKNGSTHYLPLSDSAAAIFEALPREGPFVFQNGASHLKDFKRRWGTVRARAELKNLRIHDLRRTVGSWLAQEGYSTKLIGELLNQRDPRSTEIYIRFQNQHLRDALARQAELLSLA